MQAKIFLAATMLALAGCAPARLIYKSPGIDGEGPEDVAAVNGANNARSLVVQEIREIGKEGEKKLYNRYAQEGALWWALLKPGLYIIQLRCEYYKGYTEYRYQVRVEAGKFYQNWCSGSEFRSIVKNWNEDVDPRFYDPLKGIGIEPLKDSDNGRVSKLKDG
jgi:hypothetical protein